MFRFGHSRHANSSPNEVANAQDLDSHTQDITKLKAFANDEDSNFATSDHAATVCKVGNGQDVEPRSKADRSKAPRSGNRLPEIETGSQKWKWLSRSNLPEIGQQKWSSGNGAAEVGP